MTAHKGSGQWRKRYKGRDYYFGTLKDPAAALAAWKREWPLITGAKRPTRSTARSVKLAEVALAFVRAKKAQMQRGELVWATFREYREIAQQVIDELGQATNPAELGPVDFARLMQSFARYSPIRRRNLVVKVRGIFKWAAGANLIEREPDYGPEFKGPPNKAIRKHKRERGERWFTPAQVHKLLELSGPQMRAAILLGLNCGMGNMDIGQLKKSAIDFKAGMLDATRTKTESIRRAPLWPETLEALRAIIGHDFDNVFVTESGLALCRDGTDMVGKQFQVLASVAGIGLRFYDLRRTFATVAAESVDEHARRIIMGHTIDGVHEGYVQRFPVKRLRAVTDLVRRWLFSGRNRRR